MRKSKYQKIFAALEKAREESRQEAQKALEKKRIFRNPNNEPIKPFEWTCPLCLKIGAFTEKDFHIKEYHFKEYYALCNMESSARPKRVRGAVIVGGGGSILSKRHRKSDNLD